MNAADLSPGAVVVGNGRCPTVELAEDYYLGQSRQRQQLRRRAWSPRAAVLLRAVEGVFFPGSIVALLLAVGAVLCVDAAAAALDGVLRTLVDVDSLDALLSRGVDDVAASVVAFSDFVNAQLTSPSCVDRVDLDVIKLTELLRRHRFDVGGIAIS